MSEFRVASTIVTAASGLQVHTNAADDAAVRIVSGDGTKFVTLIRPQGASAKADIDTIYQLFARVFDVLGLEP